MLKSEFWRLIDDSRHEAGGDLAAHLAAFKSALNDLEPNELISFGHWFDDYYDRADTWELRGAAHVIGGGCSDDGFLDFKGWLIARGEKVFEAALAKPDALAKVVGPGERCAAEGFAFAAQLAWARKTGKGVDEFPDSPLGPGKGGISGAPWDEAALPKLLPKLSKKFSR
jgi:hypothetical protein